MYVSPNFKTKKALKLALAEGKHVTCFAPGMGNVPRNGEASVEGPHYPAPHTWYGEVTIKDGVVVSVR